jgi:thiol-disulfide isomerase/thioredoxin
MKRNIYLLMLLPLIALLLASCGSDSSEPSGDAGPEPANLESSAQSQDPPPAVELTELEARLGNLGFQIPKEELQAIDFTLQDLAGRETSLSAFRGKVVFLNFWATWCGPCTAEIPSMEQLYTELKDQGFTIVAVNSQESAEQVSAFVQEAGMSFPVLLDSAGKAGATYTVRAIPTTYIIDPQGSIRGRMVGTREWYTPQIISLVKDLLR